MNPFKQKLLLIVVVAPVALALSTDIALSAPQPAPAQATKNQQQKSYASPEAAAKALYDAVKSHKPKSIYTVLGPGSADLIYTGDKVADQQMHDRFIAAYDSALKIELRTKNNATLLLGENFSPFPFPLVKSSQGWQFDAEAGAEEIVNRRIGENELFAIKGCLAYGDAQREYAEQDRNGNGLIEYAQKFISSEGKYDGLYWPESGTAPPSPLGLQFARARQEGYTAKQSGPAPYQGYYYRMLTRQGKDAPGGAYDYIVNGHKIGGYALIAYPARWGASGVMSFICNHDGVVFQKNLGEDTAEAAAKITEYNPDASWSKAE